MDHRVPRQVDVLRKPAPEVRRALGRGVAVADAFRVGAPVGVLAVAVLPGVAPLALAAHHVVLDEHQVAFLEALAPGEFAPGPGDHADVFVPHDDRGGRGRGLVELDVGAANPGHFHLHQRAVRRDVRHREFAQLGPARPGPDGGQDFFAHNQSSLMDRTRAGGRRAPLPRGIATRASVTPGTDCGGC